MRLLVTGGRDPPPEMLQRVENALEKIHERWPITVLIHGNARGFDKACGLWSLSNGIPTIAMDAPWEYCESIGNKKAAGPIRNKWMLDHTYPDRLLAFPGGNGTADMMRQADERGLPITRARFSA